MGLFIMYQETAQAILETPVMINITERITTWFGTRERSREFKLYPLKLGSLIRISQILLSFDDITKAEKSQVVDISYQFAQNRTRDLSKILAIAITNDQEEPSVIFINWIEHNISVKELGSVVSEIIEQMDVSKFYKFYKLKKSDKDDESKELNSLWATIGGVIKYFRFSWYQVLWELSYANVMALTATVPKYNSKKTGKEAEEDPDEEVGPMELSQYLNLGNLK